MKPDDTNEKHPETKTARLGGYLDKASGGLVPPIQLSTTFYRDENYELAVPENLYLRDDNDQVRQAESLLCELEGGEACRLYASGHAAIVALLAPLKAGDCVIIQSGGYYGVLAAYRELCGDRDIGLVEADATETDSFVELLSEVRPALVLLELPTNPMFDVCDVRAICAVAKSVGALVAVDSTALTPLLMKPIEHGADFVVHSATKVLNGHSDVMAGVVTAADSSSPFWKKVELHRKTAGAIVSPFTAWLLMRGMRTLAIRLERMCDNAQKMAEHLQLHPKIDEVLYPGLESHKGHGLAKHQFEGGFGYVMSVLVSGGEKGALEFCRQIEGIHRATSLGGTETLVEHRYTIEKGITGCPDNLVRISVGIENIKDLITELDQALL